MTYIKSNVTALKQGRRPNGNTWREAERRELARLEIGFDGRRYQYREYRYDLCSDAVNYARLDRSRPSGWARASMKPLWKKPQEPTVDEQRLMTELNITRNEKFYRYESYRYDRLADAIDYATLKR